ncbi:MAG: YopX family protein [Bacteroidales bacterium]|nr:YopX family protein [Bacteroidales bacterium]
MRREIEFRARTLAVQPQWVYGTPVFFKDGSVEIYDTDIFHTGETQFVMMHAQVDPNTICQYTGLTDKSGNKIYDGDIIRDERKKIGYISWLKQECGFVIVWKKTDSRLGHRHRGSGYDYDANLEVIGNIFDNPELQKDE